MQAYVSDYRMFAQRVFRIRIVQPGCGRAGQNKKALKNKLKTLENFKLSHPPSLLRVMWAGWINNLTNTQQTNCVTTVWQIGFVQLLLHSGNATHAYSLSPCLILYIYICIYIYIGINIHAVKARIQIRPFYYIIYIYIYLFKHKAGTCTCTTVCVCDSCVIHSRDFQAETSAAIMCSGQRAQLTTVSFRQSLRLSVWAVPRSLFKWGHKQCKQLTLGRGEKGL